MDAKLIHIAVIPNPGTGHLIPLVEFTRHLILHNPSLYFTFILIPSSAAEAASPTTPTVLTSVLPATAFHVIHLPLPSFPAFTTISDEIFSRLLRSINNSLIPLRRTIQDQTRQHRHVSALIVDIFATEAISLGSELGIKSYLFHSSSAMALSTFFHINETETTTWSPDTPLKPPGCPVIRVKDLPELAQHRSTLYHKWYMDHCKRFKSAHAILLNSFNALEEEPIKSLTTATDNPVYMVGPLVRNSDDMDNNDPSGCVRWLDGQPPESVLYVSFGSGGTLSTDQVTELAWGLELSQQRFIWVVRSPNDSVSFGTYLSLDEKTDPLGFLPRGFVERTKGRGLVVLSWAPQVKILGHGSTGGFMTHCGWNSVLEGVVNGVGFITWPLYAEQTMNAIELVEMVKVGVMVKKGEDGVVRRDVVAEVVKELMEGEQGKKIKERMRLLKDEARTTTGKDGLSNVTLSKLAHMLNN